MENQIHITKPDQLKLTAIMESMGPANKQLRHWLALLEHELDRANIVESQEIDRGIITLHSQVRLVDLHSGERLNYKLVLPSEINRVEAGLSVLAPIGIAMLGYREGDTFECDTPGGTRRFLVEAVIFQPEANARSGRSSADRQPGRESAMTMSSHSPIPDALGRGSE